MTRSRTPWVSSWTTRGQEERGSRHERHRRPSQGRTPAQRESSHRRPARPASATRTALRSAWDSPVTSYYLIGSVTLVLVALGLVFVLSSSTITSLAGDRGPLSQFQGQAMYAALVLPLAWAISRLPLRVLRVLAWPAYAGALGLQLLPIVIPGIATYSGGNLTGIDLGFMYFQPAEFAKLALALWLGAVLAAKQHQLGQLRHVALPAVGAGLMIAAQLYTHDLGTALVLGALVAGALWVAGLPARFFAALGVAGLAVVAFLATQGKTRMARILALFDPGSLEDDGLAYQSNRALEALGTGGVSGVGIGGSRSKWLYLPEANNDFILAVIGEELGLMGTLLILLLFGLLMVGLTRVVLRHPDPFAKIATAGVAAWILAQALVNIGVVIKVLPVIGIPLPFISSGGSSLIATVLAIGLVLAFARDEPGAKDALLARRGVVRRSFGVLTRRGGAA
ncbi:FtsW/RodA/SpoVE family cell cycle protein [Serinibacter arcticus]|uniref:FtsW/RodA/SpoVE family cell cycle protein n=1 Tax=Serinibacter arcticus TaxID=1655435 RepID=UPI001F175E3B|nr:FtsW/RodA/SpoVE family cell cycle protein [Serinibacter arcticus]